MKKILLTIFIMSCYMLIFSCFAENAFTKALRTCDSYSQLGGASANGQYYSILITLEKQRKSCVYKEKIFQQNSGFQMLTCKFNSDAAKFIADNMDHFTTAYAKEIAKNRIHEAKLTNNAEVFEKYLIDPKYCQVTKSKAK